MAGRDLKDVCEQAERRWASKVRLRLPIGLCAWQSHACACAIWRLEWGAAAALRAHVLHYSTADPQIIRGQARKGQLPPLGEYLQAAQQRLRELAGLPGDLPPGAGYEST